MLEKAYVNAYVLYFDTAAVFAIWAMPHSEVAEDQESRCEREMKTINFAYYFAYASNVKLQGLFKSLRI